MKQVKTPESNLGLFFLKSFLGHGYDTCCAEDSIGKSVSVNKCQLCTLDGLLTHGQTVTLGCSVDQ